MTRWWAGLGAGLLLSACGGGGAAAPQDAGIDANDFVAPAPVIDVRGLAVVHPAAALVAGGGAADFDGATARVEEPFRAALQDPSAVLGEAALASDGSFTFAAVDLAGVSQGMAVGLGGEPGSGLVRSSTWVLDTRLQPIPALDLTDVRAYAVTRALHAQLTEAVTTARIQALTGGAAASLVDAGFILGRVVDAQGAPVIGATIEPEPAAMAARIFYPTDDLRAVSDKSTGTTGLFVFVHGGGEVEPFSFRVKDRPEYGERNGAVGPGVAAVVTVFPGTTPPP